MKACGKDTPPPPGPSRLFSLMREVAFGLAKPPRAEPPQPELAGESPGGLVPTVLGPTPRAADSGGLGWSLEYLHF